MEEKTPIHACAMQGNLEGLKLLCEDIRREPIRGDKQDSKKAILCADFVLKEEEEKIDIGYKIYHVLLDKLLSHKSFSHLKKQWVMIKHYHKEKKKKNFLNQKDKFGNTALHLGSINGKARCVEYLINNFNARIDQRNNYGWMAEELIQYKEVKEVTNHHHKINTLIHTLGVCRIR
jgi:ankyrin repeat protein